MTNHKKELPNKDLDYSKLKERSMEEFLLVMNELKRGFFELHEKGSDEVIISLTGIASDGKKIELQEKLVIQIHKLFPTCI